MKVWRRTLVSPPIVVLVLSLILIVANLFFAQRTRPYISDDVSWQTIFLTWHPFSGHTAYMGNQDNFITDAPFLWLMAHFFAPTRGLLLIEAAIMACINFVLFYIAGIYFLKKCKIAINYFSLLPFLWLASFGYGLAAFFLNTNWRNFEVGASFIFFMLVAMVYFGDVKPIKSRTSQALTVLASLIAGVFIYSDPYFLYFTVLPIVTLFVVLYLLKKIGSKDLFIIISAIVLSLITSAGTRFVMARVGLLSPHATAPQFTTFSTLFSHAALALEGTLTIFGANFFGDDIKSLSSITALANLILLAVIGFQIYSFTSRLLRNKLNAKSNPAAYISTFLSWLSAFVVIVFIASTEATDVYSSRYLVIAVYAGVLLLAIHANTLQKTRTAFVILGSMAVLLNAYTAFHVSTRPQPGAEGNVANAANYSLVNAIENLGLTKGYVAYPDGNINTYLSGGSVNFLPVICSNGQTRPLKLLVDGSQFMQPSGETFIIPDNVSSPTCSEQQIIAQFGPPEQQVWAGGKTILIYNYDLMTSMSW